MKTLHKNKQGLVSITVVIIIMLLTTLIVLAFAKLIRREQRQSLDRQLNTQAFYAAEAGVNDAINALKSDANLSTFESGADCNSFSTAATLAAQLGDGSTSYSCLLVDTSPAELVYDEVGTSQSQVVPVKKKAADGNITEIKIAWQDKLGGTDFSNCPVTNTNVFSISWPFTCSPGILRVDFIAFSSAKTRDELSTLGGTIYLVPKSGATESPAFSYLSFSNTPAAQGLVSNINCNSAFLPRNCTAIINGLNVPGIAYLRLKSIYKPSSVTVSAKSGATTLDLVGTQAVIDVTGKANDVLRRIQVRVPLFVSEPMGEFALESATTICKRLVNDGVSIINFNPAEPDCDPWQVGN